MGEKDGRKENRQPSDNTAADRTVEKRGRTKIRKRILAGILLLLFWIFTVTCVQAIELGGFDVDMGTGNFEDDPGWDQEENTGETPSSDNDDHDSSGGWSGTDNSWNTGETSSEAGAGSYTGENTTQSATDWNDFSSADSHLHEEENSNNAGQNSNSETNGITTDQQNNNGAVNEAESMEQQISDMSPTPEPSPTAVFTIRPSPTPVTEIQRNVLTVPKKEDELPEEECRQKMQIMYFRKEIRNASLIEITSDPQLAAVILSVRINGKEADWKRKGAKILVKMMEGQEYAEIEIAVMCRRELSWTEAKKNAILTYNIF